MSATYEDANLILKLFELRREEKLRKAREWFVMHFGPKTLAELNQMAPPGTDANNYYRMVISYWDMVASFITSGVLNQELFFQSGGELLVVWSRIKPIIGELRAFTKNPKSWKNIETVGEAYIEHFSHDAPEAYKAFEERMNSILAATKAKG